MGAEDSPIVAETVPSVKSRQFLVLPPEPYPSQICPQTPLRVQ